MKKKKKKHVHLVKKQIQIGRGMTAGKCRCGAVMF